MSAEFALTLAFIVSTGMWACWKLGFERGQHDIIEKYQDYYRQRRASEEDEE